MAANNALEAPLRERFLSVEYASAKADVSNFIRDNGSIPYGKRNCSYRLWMNSRWQHHRPDEQKRFYRVWSAIIMVALIARMRLFGLFMP